MDKGLLIMLFVFVVVALLHIISQKMTSLSEKKKRKFRKVFWYFYGVIFIIQGIIRMIEEEHFLIFSALMSLFGLFFIIMNYLDKINPKKDKE